MDEELQEGFPQPEQLGRKSKRRQAPKEMARQEAAKVQFPDPQAGHRKFMAAMIGLFVVALLLMLFFNNYMDFAVDGGI